MGVDRNEASTPGTVIPNAVMRSAKALRSSPSRTPGRRRGERVGEAGLGDGDGGADALDSSASFVDGTDHSAGDASMISAPGKADDSSPENSGVMASTPIAGYRQRLQRP